MEESDAVKIKGLQVEMKNNSEMLSKLDKKFDEGITRLSEKLDRNFGSFTHQLETLEKSKVSHRELARELDTAVNDRLNGLEKEQKRMKNTLRIAPVITFIGGAIISPVIVFLIIEYFKTH